MSFGRRSFRGPDPLRADAPLHEHYVIGQDQDNRRPDNPPNQGCEPPLVWSVEFMKKVVHVVSNDTAPLGFRLIARAMAPHSPSANSGKQKGERIQHSLTSNNMSVWFVRMNMSWARRSSLRFPKQSRERVIGSIFQCRQTRPD